MAIAEDDWLWEILACPACRAKVERSADGATLKCVECRRIYPIQDGIPVMDVDRAVIEDEESPQTG